jgi:hypothetical protein
MGGIRLRDQLAIDKPPPFHLFAPPVLRVVTINAQCLKIIEAIHQFRVSEVRSS